MSRGPATRSGLFHEPAACSKGRTAGPATVQGPDRFHRIPALVRVSGLRERLERRGPAETSRTIRPARDCGRACFDQKRASSRCRSDIRVQDHEIRRQEAASCECRPARWNTKSAEKFKPVPDGGKTFSRVRSGSPRTSAPPRRACVKNPRTPRHQTSAETPNPALPAKPQPVGADLDLAVFPDGRSDPIPVPGEKSSRSWDPEGQVFRGWTSIFSGNSRTQPPVRRTAAGNRWPAPPERGARI